jgi:AraC family transcriptional regulator
VNRPAIADYPPGAGLPPRVIDDFEFVWMLRGNARFTAGEEFRVVVPEVRLIRMSGADPLAGLCGLPVVDRRR